MVSQRNYDIDYANDLALLANTPIQTESLLYSLGQAAEDIGLNKTVHVFLNKNYPSPLFVVSL